MGADLIRLGRQVRVIVGGAQEISWQSICSFDGLGAFSKRTDDPERASRPFDRDRDGLVPSGGAAALLLEERGFALARGAPILGEILGYGFSSDGEHISVPSREGLSRAMDMAIGSAGLKPGDIDHISAHATSTPAGDAAEAANIKRVFGAKTPPISAIKGMTGHELWMSGASQAVYETLMARGGFIAKSLNFEKPDADTEGLDIVDGTLARGPRLALLNSAGFGGTNAALVLGF